MVLADLEAMVGPKPDPLSDLWRYQLVKKWFKCVTPLKIYHLVEIFQEEVSGRFQWVDVDAGDDKEQMFLFLAISGGWRWFLDSTDLSENWQAIVGSKEEASDHGK